MKFMFCGPLHLHYVERLVTLYASHFEEQFLVHNFYKSKGSFIPDSYIVKLR